MAAGDGSTVGDALKRGSVVTFKDVSIGGVPQGRLFLELFKDVAPKVRWVSISALAAVQHGLPLLHRLWRILDNSALGNTVLVGCHLATKAQPSTG